MWLVANRPWSTMVGWLPDVARYQLTLIGEHESLSMPLHTQAAAPKIRLFLVDDEPMVRKGFRLFASLQSDMTVCGEAASEGAALREIAALKPDLVVVDLGLKGGTGLEVIKELHRVHPQIRILVFSMHDEAFYVEQALGAGAHGYVTKEEGTETALQAIRSLMQGKRYLSAKAAAKMTGMG